ncbi:MAG: Na/Pi cotransporter family protein, partial [Victivallales bacterium]|nr:Na/Pi cotransporter family protein [Victivallales bacterium]
AGRKAKQVAMAATVFKLMGVFIAIPLFYVNWNGHPCLMELINQLTAGDVFNAYHENIGRHLANAHTVFNILNVALFIPLTGLVVKLTLLLMPDTTSDAVEDNHLCRLENHLLNTPSAALDQVVIALTTMTRAAVDLTREATEAFIQGNTAIEANLRKQENRIDEAQKDIIDYLVQLTRRNLTENQSSAIPLFMHCVNDVERIGDRAINIYDLISQMPSIENGMIDPKNTDVTDISKESKLSIRAIMEISEICDSITNMAELLIDGLKRNDEEAFNKVMKRESEIKNLTSRFEHNHEVRLKTQDCTVQKGIVFVEALANLERISAHLANLAERARDMAQHRMTF